MYEKQDICKEFQQICYFITGRNEPGQDCFSCVRCPGIIFWKVQTEVMEVITEQNKMGRSNRRAITTFNCCKVCPESVSRISGFVFQKKKYSKTDQTQHFLSGSPSFTRGNDKLILCDFFFLWLSLPPFSQFCFIH